MFNWSTLPAESLDNSHDELQSTAALSSPSSTPTAFLPPAGPSSSAPQPLQQSAPSSMLSVPRSASTSQINSISPTQHFEAANAAPYPLSTGTRSHQRSLLPESALPTAGSSRQSSINSGLKIPSNSFSDDSAAGPNFRGPQSGLSLDPPTIPWWYTRKREDPPDFVLISEFSEVEGPRAVMTIPDSIVDLTRDSYSARKQRVQEPFTKHSQDIVDASTSILTSDNTSNSQDMEDMFDVHEFVLRITSVDQQAKETSGIFHIPEDIEVHVTDTEKGYWAYVHHFTLFDINARGFVRPFCMSYITRDPHKILTHYEKIRNKFSRAALYFKTGNYTLFRQELTKKLRDLNYTNNLLSEAPTDSSCSLPDTLTATTLRETTLPPRSSQDTLTHSVSEPSNLSGKESEAELGESLSEQQRADLESIKDGIETATHIISMLEHYSVDGQPLLGHPDDGNDVPNTTAPLSDLAPVASSENLTTLATGRSGSTDQSLFLGAQTSRPGSRIRRKPSTQNVPGAVPSRILDAASGSGGGITGIMAEGITAPLPHLLGLQQQEQSRKNSVVSENDPMMYEAPEYEAQYVTTLYPLFRDEVVFRQLRELCIVNIAWNSSIQFHLGIKKIKDILKEFQTDSQLLGETADCISRMLHCRFVMNFRNPDFNRVTVRQTQQHQPPVPMVELLQGISLANAPSDDGLSKQEILLPETQESAAVSTPVITVDERRPGPNMEAEDADDEQTGYDSLDDAASFFTAATGLATQTETPTKDSFSIAPLDRSARVVEWHQEQQTLHHTKGGAPNVQSSNQSTRAGAVEQVPWTFDAGVNQGEQSLANGTFNRTPHRQSAQSGVNMGVAATTGSIQTVYCPTVILDTMQKDPVLAKHLAFALLSGQKVCVMGQSENESKVRAFVSVLATFLPHAGFPSREEQLIEHQRQIVPWYPGPGSLQIEAMDELCLVGVDTNKVDPKFLESSICILDYDTLTWINGRQYTDGILLESIFSNMSVFSEDTSFLAFVDSKLFEMLLKSFLYYHLVFHGRLSQSGLLGPPFAQAIYSSGASDDGEAFSHQRNFRSSRSQSVSSKNTVISRISRRNTSAYPTNAHLGATVMYNNLSAQNESLTSPESSDDEVSLEGQLHQGKYDESDAIFSHQQLYEKEGGISQVMSADDESSGLMLYTNSSQGMRKWKKWLEYWGARSAAMIDPARARAAFGKLDLTGAAIDSPSTASGNRRKRNSSRRSSPHRRSKNSSGHHASSGRQREAREREKERDVERDRDRSRKSMVDHFDTNEEKLIISSSSEPEVMNKISNEDMAAFERELIMDEKSSKESPGGRSDGHHGTNNEAKVDDIHANMDEAYFPSSNTTGEVRRLKPKLPLLLQSSTSRVADSERDRSGQEDRTASANREDLKRTPSSGSVDSPPPSATSRSLADALRGAFGHPSTTAAPDTTSPTDHFDASARGRRSSDEQHSPWSSREVSDSNQTKEVKWRGSSKAKAKAWFGSKKKNRNRLFEDEQAGQETLEDVEADHNNNHGSENPRSSHLVQESEDSELTVRAIPRSAS
ncbi:hypothetical protein BGZ65_000449, partial [Modicella reniformis]